MTSHTLTVILIADLIASLPVASIVTTAIFGHQCPEIAVETMFLLASEIPSPSNKPSEPHHDGGNRAFPTLVFTF